MRFKFLIAFLFMASAFLAGAQTLQTLLSFNSADGANSVAALTLGNDGNFYGTTYNGGNLSLNAGSGDGTVFKLTTNGALTTLVSFSSTNGANPYAGLTLGNDGNFYGTTSETLFKLTTNGTLTTMVSFNVSGGAYPNALTLGNDGGFYGTTQVGGGGFGTVFRWTTNGTLTNLLSFNTNNDPYPNALTLGNDGNLYGTAEETIFKVTTNGALTTLASFYYTNGANLIAPLTLGNDGSFYGTTEEGGRNNYGTVFQVTTNGALTALVSFSFTNGANPYAGLTLGNDGNFYGTTANGGITNSAFPQGMGTLFQVTTNGALTTLVCFSGSNGAVPESALTLGNDGNFYGTTAYGGTGGYGTAFRLLLLPVIAVQPQCQTNFVGATVTFSVSATYLPPAGYQWLRNGTNLADGGNISGATNSTLTLTGISDSDAATYSLVVSDAYGSVTTSNAVLTVNDSLFIASQPQNQTVGLGSNVTLNVTVFGAPPFVFQWYFDETPLGSPGAGTNVSCTLTNVGTNQAGTYSVLIVNACGDLMSSNAVLTVKVFPPAIALQPSSQRVMIGSSVSFSVSVSGTPPFYYQWQFNGTNLIDAPNASYAIQAAATNDTGNYSVIVTNLAGSVTSSNALLTVIIQPTLALELSAGYALLNLNGMLSNSFVVQYSTNLEGTNWINLLSLPDLPYSPYLFLDPSGVGQPARFYRVFMR
ncbi:MAG: choice-of-anchor tandem repeat GloVer-containing protein [Verrucomicrobiota bacterium]